MKPTILLLILPLLTGCLTTTGDRAAGAMALGVNLYCRQPSEIRTYVRYSANSRMDDGNSVTITCGVDGE